MKKKVLVLGCTGSIGTSTIDIIRRFPDRFSLVGITAHSSQEKLLALSQEFGDVPTLLTQNASKEKIERFISQSNADIAVNGIAGSAGLLPSVTTLESGIDLALANKETIVMAGSLVQKIARENKCSIIPVDSEHSAVFNLIQRFGVNSVQEIILTASGGPFRELPKDKLAVVTARDALKHPTWSMGKKITIDSATLANKGLEVIEACRLFDIPPERVKVVVHPQSLVHSLIRTSDGVLYAQISPPDMRHPILNALSWPEFIPSTLDQLDLTNGVSMSFHAPRDRDFPMLPLAYEAIKKGGAYAIAYNAANEVAVPAFLDGKISFHDISKIVQAVMEEDWTTEPVTIDEVFLFDSKARQDAEQVLTKNTEVSL